MSYRMSAPPAYPSITPANGMGAYYGTQPLEPVKGLGEMDLPSWVNLAGFASMVALTYHGYKRGRGSVGSALLWGLLGGVVWPITLPIAVAQGFGKAK
jgi:hypothetical protein